MAWSDPIVAGTNWSGRGAGSVLELLTQAVSERHRAAYGDAGQPIVPVPSLGDVVALDEFYSAVAPSVTGLQTVVAYDLLDILAAGTGPFVDHTQSFTGATFPARWTMPTIRAAAGLPTAYHYIGDSTLAAFLAATNNVFRRKRYRQIPNSAAVRDTQGNAAAAGQRARLTSDGTLWRCVSSGDWTRDESAGPDVLDNTLAPPNTVSTLGVPPTAGGGVQPGDILGAWVFEELRLIVDLLRWTVATLDPSDVRHVEVQDPAAPEPDYAAAVAAAQAAYAAASIVDPGSGAVGASGLIYAVADGTYKWAARRSDRSWSALAVFSASLSSLTKRPLWYVKGSAAGFDPYGSSPPTFDAHGDPVSNGSFSLWQTQADTGGAVASGTWGQIGTCPGFPADPGSTSGVVAVKGYQLDDVQCVLKWNVAGGFQHCTVTV